MLGSNANTSLFGNGEAGAEKKVSLFFHRYRYFPYEKELARREVERFAVNCSIVEKPNGMIVSGPVDLERLRRLTYISTIRSDREIFNTIQHDLENPSSQSQRSSNRQSTRYSAHALHEYKGRFNPQLVAFLLNYLGAESNTRILDPFCGSGTTLVESAIHGVGAVGIDMNPLAVFISNAKLQALTTSADQIETALSNVLISFENLLCHEQLVLFESDDRQRYLASWFAPEALLVIEALRKSILENAGNARPILLALVSDLLRDYSLQEPADLRIRRRTSPAPAEPLIEVFRSKAKKFIKGLAASQKTVGIVDTKSKAFVGDSRNVGEVTKLLGGAQADLVVTSPPYSTALPYIDIQRLSLVWLDLCSAASIRRLEGDAVGSREKRAAEPEWARRIAENSDALPEEVVEFCRKIARTLTITDGFRRRAMPALVYRYFADMKQVFFTLSQVVKKRGRLAFVIGSNHTTIGGNRFEIETSKSLAAIALQFGFRVVDHIGLQTYHRYELHRKNSIRREDLTIFELP